MEQSVDSILHVNSRLVGCLSLLAIAKEWKPATTKLSYTNVVLFLYYLSPLYISLWLIIDWVIP